MCGVHVGVFELALELLLVVSRGERVGRVRGDVQVLVVASAYAHVMENGERWIYIAHRVEVAPNAIDAPHHPLYMPEVVHNVEKLPVAARSADELLAHWAPVPVLETAVGRWQRHSDILVLWRSGRG